MSIVGGCRASVVGMLTLLLAQAIACTTRPVSSGGATDPEHQSISEFNLGLDALQHSDFRVALSHALRAVQLDDQSARAAALAAAVYLGLCNGPRGLADPDCRLADAEKYARLAQKLVPNDPDAKNTLADVLINEKRYPEAIALLKPITADPSYTSIHLAWGNLGLAQLDAGDVDSSIVSLKNAIAANARFNVGFYRLGIAYEKKGDLAQADANLTSAVDGEAGKSFQAAFEERAKVRLSLGQNDYARADFERCKQLAPESESGRRCTQSLEAKP